MATFNFQLRTEKKDKSGTCPIYLRLYHRGRSKYYYSGIRVKPGDWLEGSQRVRQRESKHAIFNHELKRIEVKVDRIYFEQKSEGVVKLDKIVQALKGPEEKDFFTYAETYNDRLRKGGNVRRAKQTKVIGNKIEDFHGSRTGLLLTDIDHAFLSDLQAHLKEKYDNAPNTIRKDFNRLKMLLLSAKKDGLIKENPFNEYKLPKKQRSKKTALSREQIIAMEGLDLRPGTRVWHARNYFLFSYYNAGIRIGDMCKLKRKHVRGGRLKYLMDKTKNNSTPKYKSIKLRANAVQILESYNYQDKLPEDYLFPIVDPAKDLTDPFVWDREKQSKTAMINKALKEVAALAGIEESISTHIARHSYANFANQSNMSVYSISKSMGHSELSTTEQYLSNFDEEKIDNEMDELFN